MPHYLMKCNALETEHGNQISPNLSKNKAISTFCFLESNIMIHNILSFST